VGTDVTHVRPGDTVFVTWVPRSPEAAAPWRGGMALMLGNGSTASTSDVFTWATHTITDQSLVVKAPVGVAHDVSSIIGCAVMTGAGAVMHTAGVKKGESVAVFGAGGVGLSAVIAASVLGADPIIAVDVDDEKLAFAKRFGASHGVNARSSDAVDQIRSITRGGRDGLGFRGMAIEGVDYAFDCIGHKVTMEQILAAARPGRFGVERGGTAVLVGVPTTGMDLNVTDLLLAEKRYIGSIGGSCTPDRDFPVFAQWHADGRLPLDDMVTSRFALEEVNEACDALANGRISGRAIFDLEA
jgi:Zn-dependent alcohol dehydrogenase